MLNMSYEWCCSAGVGADPAGIGNRLLRTLDWPMPGLGRAVVVARQEGAAGRYYNVTWPGYVGVLTAMAPGRFSAAINQPPLRRFTRSLPVRLAARAARRCGATDGLAALAPAAPGVRRVPRATRMRSGCWSRRRSACRPSSRCPAAAAERGLRHRADRDGGGGARGAVLHHQSLGRPRRSRPRPWQRQHRAPREHAARSRRSAGDTFSWLAAPTLNRHTRLVVDRQRRPRLPVGAGLGEGWARRPRCSSCREPTDGAADAIRRRRRRVAGTANALPLWARTRRSISHPMSRTEHSSKVTDPRIACRQQPNAMKRDWQCSLT